MARKTIICIDDEKIVLNSLMGQLYSSFGNKYNYEFFESAEEAEEFIDETYAEGDNVDLIICDWLMPRVRGDEFLIKIHQRFPDISMIMLSGHVDEEAIKKVKKYTNLSKLITKPWDKDDLIKTIEEILSSKMQKPM